MGQETQSKVKLSSFVKDGSWLTGTNGQHQPMTNEGEIVGGGGGGSGEQAINHLTVRRKG